MSAPAIVWLAVGLVGTALLAMFLVALVRHGLLVGRSAARLAREAGAALEGVEAPGRGRGTRR